MHLSRRSRALMLFTAHQTAMHLATVGGLTVALPAMMAEFHADVATVVWVQVAYSLALAGGTIPLGQLGPLVGRRRLSQGFGGDDARGPVAENHVFHRFALA